MGSTMTEHIDVETPQGSGPFRVELAMGAGRLDVRPGAGQKIIAGTVTYNVEELKPIVTVTGDTVRVEQHVESLRTIRGNIKNDWDLKLGDAPMSFNLKIGAAKGDIDLGGLSLSGLSISQGATDFELSFKRPNQVEMADLSFQAGAAKSDLSGLSNANAESMNFSGGAGDLRLDFSGELRRDLHVSIKAAAGNVVIDVPRGVPARANLSSILSNVKMSGGWTQSGGTYQLPGDGPAISFDLKMSVGQVSLRSS